LTSGLLIRPAERRDAAELAILVDIASHGFASWLWYGAVIKGEVDTAMERGRARMRDDAIDDGWKSALIAEIDGETVGASVGHAVPPDIQGGASTHPSLLPLVTLQKRIVGHWFIDSIAVYRSHRGKGVGRGLLGREFSRAGGAAVGLITESHNTTAQSLYRSSGFQEQTRLDAYRISESSEPFQWVLMTRPAANERQETHGRIL
jgi:ribosomal protein S18 acetylase RimI-like enzyme